MATTTKTGSKSTKGSAAAEAATAAGADTTAITAPDPAGTAMQEFDDYGEDAKKGYENQNMSDRKIPMVFMVQPNSPQVKDRKALPGQLFNSVTGEAYDTIEIVPCITDHVAIEWVGRDDGGGYRGRHALNSQIYKDAVKRNGGKSIGKLIVPSTGKDDKGKDLPQTELVETYEIAGVIYQAWRDGVALYAGDEAVMPVVISFKSTAIKVYKELSSNLGMFQLTVVDPATGAKRKQEVPLFAHRVRMGTAEDSKNGQAFYVPTLAPAEGTIPKSLMRKADPRYVAAKMLHEQYLKGVVSADYATTTNDAGGGGGDAAPDAGKAPF